MNANKDIVIIAHRGCSYPNYFENTLPAFEKVIDEGVTAVELDVQKSRNGDLFIFHDIRLDTKTNGRGRIPMRSTKYLKSIFATDKKNVTEKIPLLEDLLKIIAKKKPEKRPLVNVELKQVGTGKPTAKIIKQYISSGKLLHSNFLISSFFKRELFKFRKYLPEMKISFLDNSIHLSKIFYNVILGRNKASKKDKRERLSLRQKIDYCKKLIAYIKKDTQGSRMTIVVLYESLKMLLLGRSLYYKLFFSLGKSKGISGVHMPYRNLSKLLISQAHKNGFFVWTYTINQFSEIQRAIEKGVDGFFTDFYLDSRRYLENYKVSLRSDLPEK